MAIKSKLKKFNRKLNNRGFTYLIISSFLLAVLLTVFLSANYYKYQDKTELYQVRIRAMNDFVNNFNDDAYRASYIAAFRSMIALEDYVTSTGNYLNNTNESFRELFYYGTLNNVTVAILENSSFQDYLLKINQLAQSVGIIVNVNVTEISLSQPDPWSIDVDVSANINISDSKRLASWVYNREFITNIPIYDLRDPLYSKNIYNVLPQTIRRLNSTSLVNGTDATNLNTLINGSYYLASPDAPSYLMRFEGQTGNSSNGIVSIVNIRKLSDQDIIVYPDKVKVDYIYFSNITVPNMICDVQNINTDFHFIIPEDMKGLYQIDSSGGNLTFNTTCP